MISCNIIISRSQTGTLHIDSLLLSNITSECNAMIWLPNNTAKAKHSENCDVSLYNRLFRWGTKSSASPLMTFPCTHYPFLLCVSLYPIDQFIMLYKYKYSRHPHWATSTWHANALLENYHVQINGCHQSPHLEGPIWIADHEYPEVWQYIFFIYSCISLTHFWF